MRVTEICDAYLFLSDEGHVLYVGSKTTFIDKMLY